MSDEMYLFQDVILFSAIVWFLRHGCEILELIRSVCGEARGDKETR